MAAGAHRPLASVLLAAMAVSCTGPAGVEVDPDAGPVPLFVLGGSAVALDLTEASDFAIHFGTVEAGRTTTPELWAENAGDAPLVLEFEEVPPPYSLEATRFELAPKERRPLEILFAPTVEGIFDRLLVVETNEKEPPRRIRLLGRATPTCTLEVDPPSLDLGDVGVRCTSRPSWVSIGHRCHGSVTIHELRADPRIAFDSLPSLPTTLSAGQRLSFRISFRPEEPGPAMAEVEIRASREEGSPLVAHLDLEAVGQPSGGVVTDSFLVQGPPKVDLLWVVDNTSSMAEWDELLEQTLPELMARILELPLDLHVGVTTTAVGEGETCGDHTGFSEKENGRLVPHPTLGPRILRSSLGREEFLAAFRRNLLVGACLEDGSIYEAAKRALTEPLVEMPLDEVGNAGFLRHDAALAIVGVTDRSDDAIGDESLESDVEAYLSFFWERKPARARHSVRLHMISGGLEPCENERAGRAEACPECVLGTELSGGTFMEICSLTDDFGWDPLSLEAHQFPHSTASFSLRGEPADVNGDGAIDGEDIEVRLEGEAVAERTESGTYVWRYSPADNSIHFSPPFVPAPSSVVEVTYQLACPRSD